MEFPPGQRIQILDTLLLTSPGEVAELKLVGLQRGCGQLVRSVFEAPFYRRYRFDRFHVDLGSNPGWRTAVFSGDGPEKPTDSAVVQLKGPAVILSAQRPSRPPTVRSSLDSTYGDGVLLNDPSFSGFDFDTVRDEGRRSRAIR